jgi:heme-degrading monooxygenase HmoA
VAVFVRIKNTAVSLDLYDELAKQLVPALQSQPGFLYHFAYGENGALVVNEIWESREQQTAWFDGVVRPNLPPEADPQVDVIELHNLATP